MAYFANLVRRHLLWLLLPTYVIAYLLPGPGAYAAQLTLMQGIAGPVAVQLPMLLVGVLLLSAAMQVDVADASLVAHRPDGIIAALLAVWAAPAAVVLVAGALFQATGGGQGGGLLLGMILVAAMPVANSSAGWTQQAGGSLSWALALVVLSIVLCPLVTPGVIRLLGMSLSTADSANVEDVVGKFSGVSFIVWVLAPTFTGMLIRRFAGAGRIKQIKPWLHLATAAAILGLNYLNGSLVLPSIFPQPDAALLIAAVCGAAALSVGGLLAAQLLTMALRWGDQARLALKFTLSMKHTGLALGLASTVLADQKDAILLIILATPIQHLVAGMVSRRYGLGEVD